MFFAPTEEEVAFMEMWENLVNAMPPAVRCDDGRSRTGRHGYTLLSKKTDALIRLVDFSCVIASICSSFYEDRLVCHLSIDSTVAEAREKPVKTGKEKKEKKERTEEERFRGAHHRRGEGTPV